MSHNKKTCGHAFLGEDDVTQGTRMIDPTESNLDAVTGSGNTLNKTNNGINFKTTVNGLSKNNPGVVTSFGSTSSQIQNPPGGLRAILGMPQTMTLDMQP
ncbi:hypothetical protein K435DRAFT_853384 [Dendrothele bispora CBS 962.96]|uniref:Uncharacterized protein n=1 Tax=Dendrothele bispora (strain CBS 962.96) TaxID=1314807 RepID=A0A4S8MGM9_DENBC|nr:hypothetical protein K435DRAFT_853384 [Dendrothele bispora CBS 962.96]